MQRKWLFQAAAVTAMMILLGGCSDMADGIDVSDQTDSGEIHNTAGVPVEEGGETQNTASTTDIVPEERKLLYRVLFHLPDDTDPEDDEVVCENEYNEAGRLLRETNYDTKFCTEYEYDASGKLIKSTEYFRGGLYNWVEYEYDASGYLVRENNYGPDGSSGAYTEYENDSSGNLLKEVSYRGDGSIYNSVEYTYDESGNLAEETRYEETPHDNYETRIEYTYDESGNLLRETGYTNGRFYHYNEYVYDSDGNLARKEVHYISSFNEDDILNHYYEYTYDKWGDLLTAVMYDRDGNVDYDTVNEKFIVSYRYEYITVKF